MSPGSYVYAFDLILHYLHVQFKIEHAQKGVAIRFGGDRWKLVQDNSQMNQDN